jgi:hypothetical protein
METAGKQLNYLKLFPALPLCFSRTEGCELVNCDAQSQIHPFSSVIMKHGTGRGKNRSQLDLLFLCGYKINID